MKIILTAKSVNKKLNEYSEIKNLCATAFPKNEQMPMWILLLLSKRNGIDFTAYYDNDTFCGISYTVFKNNTVFVLYLAVNDKIRSKGYGSKILDSIKKNYNGKSIVLNIEPLDSNAENYEQRVKRFEFYKRNGFSSTNHLINDISGKYLILSTSKSFSVKAYKDTIKKLSFGFYNPKVLVQFK